MSIVIACDQGGNSIRLPWPLPASSAPWPLPTSSEQIDEDDLQFQGEGGEETTRMSEAWIEAFSSDRIPSVPVSSISFSTSALAHCGLPETFATREKRDLEEDEFSFLPSIRQDSRDTQAASRSEIIIRPRILTEHSKSTVRVSKEALASLYHLPLKQAASELGVSATSFKRVCRSLGVRAWPYRFQEMASPNESPHAQAEQRTKSPNTNTSAGADGKVDKQHAKKGFDRTMPKHWGGDGLTGASTSPFDLDADSETEEVFAAINDGGSVGGGAVQNKHGGGPGCGRGFELATKRIGDTSTSTSTSTSINASHCVGSAFCTSMNTSCAPSSAKRARHLGSVLSGSFSLEMGRECSVFESSDDAASSLAERGREKEELAYAPAHAHAHAHVHAHREVTAQLYW